MLNAINAITEKKRELEERIQYTSREIEAQTNRLNEAKLQLQELEVVLADLKTPKQNQ